MGSMRNPVNRTAGTARSVLVDVQRLEKTYANVRALKGVTFDIAQGEVVALLGLNGAGKTTLLRILGGLMAPDSGEIVVDGRPVLYSDPSDAISDGIVLVTQEPELCDDLSVLDNVWLGVETGVWWRTVAASQASIRPRFRNLLSELGLQYIDMEGPCGNLPLAIRQSIVLGRAFLSGARLLLLDEPMTSMSSSDSATLLKAIRHIATAGASVLLSTHRLDLAREIADRVLVLRDGALVGDLRDQEVGKALAEPPMPPHKRLGNCEQPAAPVFQLLNGCAGALKGVSFTVSEGEIVALDGPPLADLSLLLRGLAGLGSLDGGEVLVSGITASIATAAQALDAGIAYVTSDRRGEGIFEGLSIAENIAIGVAGSLANRFGILLPSAENAIAQAFAVKLRLVGPELCDDAASLSGGNQQRVVLARVLATRPSVLLLDNATRGLDSVGRGDLATCVRNFCRDGGACIVSAAEHTFLSAIADRIVMLSISREATPPR